MARELNNGPVVQKEKETVTKMIYLYCKKKHHHEELCAECQDLKDYALKRLSLCRFGEDKTACSNCPVHCYKPEYRQKIKAVMRYSGPWMLVYHPVYAVKHLLNK
jgi:predicted amidophosphoribosyltransferase